MDTVVATVGVIGAVAVLAYVINVLLKNKKKTSTGSTTGSGSKTRKRVQ